MDPRPKSKAITGSDSGFAYNFSDRFSLGGELAWS